MTSKAWSLGVASGLMIILGYPGELIIEGDLGVRWMYWCAVPERTCPGLCPTYLFHDLGSSHCHFRYGNA